MARINIEDALFSDERFLELADKVGRYEAIGRLVFFWKLAQKHYVDTGGGGIPAEIMNRRDVYRPIIENGLAEKRGDYYHAKGMEAAFAWILRKKLAGKAGGKKSAQLRASKTQGVLKQTPSKSNPLTLTPTLTLTPKTKSTNVLCRLSADGVKQRATVQDFICLWNKHRGILKKCVRASESRKRKIKIRLGEEPDLAYWETCIKKLAASQFAQEGKWATLDWLVTNDNNHVKVSEGNYDNASNANTNADRPQLTGAERNRILAEQADRQLAKQNEKRV